jgi:magnesium-transporting ATPase (P-type)
MDSTFTAAIDVPVTSRQGHEGLSEREAKERLRQLGPNDPAARKHGALAFELLLLLLNPLVLILLIASGISVVVGQSVDATIIFVIAMLSVAINFVQMYRSQRAVQKLQEHVSVTATVLRDGTWQEVRRERIVPGDLVRLGAGDLIPADGRLLDSRDLYVQQAALTGESMPVEKGPRGQAGRRTKVRGLQVWCFSEHRWLAEPASHASLQPVAVLRSGSSARSCVSEQAKQNLSAACGSSACSSCVPFFFSFFSF